MSQADRHDSISHEDGEQLRRYFQAKISEILKQQSDLTIAVAALADDMRKVSGSEFRKFTCQADPEEGIDLKGVIASYLGSAEFGALAQSTKNTYRGIVLNLEHEMGGIKLRSLNSKTIFVAVRKKSGPCAAANRLKLLKVLLRHAASLGWIDSDPTCNVKLAKYKSEGFHSWTDAEIEKFKAKHPPNSRAHLALMLLLWTAQRRSDVVRMGFAHIAGNLIRIRQNKTKIVVTLPIAKELEAAIRAIPAHQETFLVTEMGKPFTSSGFGNWFRDVCREAGLHPSCAAHGLRKAAARRLAEAGCSAYQIMAITGHRTIREVTRYTDAVNRTHLAEEAIQKLAPYKRTNTNSHPS